MNNYEYLLNNYNRAFSANDFNILPQTNQNQNQNPNSNINNNILGINPNIQLYTPQEAYDKGNLFSNLYQQYEGYQPTILKANNERERMFLEFSRMAFAAHELNLFLDNYPNNSSMLRLFSDYANRAKNLEQEYQQKYGPITVSNTSGEKIPFQWENEAWPWEGEF